MYNVLKQDNSTPRVTALIRPTHRRTDANLYPLERQLTKASEPSFDLKGKSKI